MESKSAFFSGYMQPIEAFWNGTSAPTESNILMLTYLVPPLSERLFTLEEVSALSRFFSRARGIRIESDPAPGACLHTRRRKPRGVKKLAFPRAGDP